eukprot:scaffold184404_cov19-Tisochrysis_lutea.AAC.1
MWVRVEYRGEREEHRFSTQAHRVGGYSFSTQARYMGKHHFSMQAYYVGKHRFSMQAHHLGEHHLAHKHMSRWVSTDVPCVQLTAVQSCAITNRCI